MMVGGLTFDPAAHAYTFAGVPVVSVTKVLGRLNDLSGIDAGVLENARLRGQAVHKAVELDIAGELDETDLHPEVAARLGQWRQFCRITKFEPLASELRVYSARYGYAGTLDLFGTLRRERILLDLKATAAIPATVGMQTAAYAQALRESIGCGPIRRAVLRLAADRFEFLPLNRPADLSDFLAELSQFRETQK